MDIHNLMRESRRATNQQMSISEFDQAVHNGIKRNKLYIIFGGIFLGFVMFYGLDEEDKKQQEFFDKGDGYSTEYKIRVGGHIYYLGEMVSHWANIAILTIVGILIAWITCWAIQARIWK